MEYTLSICFPASLPKYTMIPSPSNQLQAVNYPSPALSNPLTFACTHRTNRSPSILWKNIVLSSPCPYSVIQTKFSLHANICFWTSGFPPQHSTQQSSQDSVAPSSHTHHFTPSHLSIVEAVPFGLLLTTLLLYWLYELQILSINGTNTIFIILIENISIQIYIQFFTRENEGCLFICHIICPANMCWKTGTHQ